MTEIPGLADPAVAQLDDLIALLAGATEGSDRLDGRIRRYLSPPPGHRPGLVDPPAPYTTSLDAALALVPEGWRDDVDLELSLGEFGKQLGAKSCFACLATGHIQTPSTKQVTAHAHTPALALCIAALKARLSNAEASR